MLCERNNLCASKFVHPFREFSHVSIDATDVSKSYNLLQSSQLTFDDVAITNHVIVTVSELELFMSMMMRTDVHDNIILGLMDFNTYDYQFDKAIVCVSTVGNNRILHLTIVYKCNNSVRIGICHCDVRRLTRVCGLTKLSAIAYMLELDILYPVSYDGCVSSTLDSSDYFSLGLTMYVNKRTNMLYAIGGFVQTTDLKLFTSSPVVKGSIPNSERIPDKYITSDKFIVITGIIAAEEAHDCINC